MLGRLNATVLILVVLVTSACGGPTSTATSMPTPTPSVAAPSPTHVGVDLTVIPTACIGLAPDDCRRVVATVGELVPAGMAATYVQVGPFGCADVAPCAASLAARPQGDITIEAGAGALSWHVTATDGGGDLRFEQQDAFGVRLGPESAPPVVAGVRPFTLGHCGLFSGIDVGGSWWDPVGQVDYDHPDVINAADGTLAILDPDHATFTSMGGLTVQLVRRDGEKYMPFCD